MTEDSSKFEGSNLMSQLHNRPSSGNGTEPFRNQETAIAIDPSLLLREMYESVADFAILTTDMDSCITSWNAGAAKIFGYQADEVLGKSMAITFTREDVNDGQPFREMDAAKTHGRAADYRWHMRKDGTLFWADGILKPILNDQHVVIGFMKILRDITERKVADDEIKRLASIDGLTSLYNRAAFDARRAELASTALRTGQKLLLFLIDLDRFKEVNDTLGHQAGDQLLQEVGKRIRKISRESDIVARIGGDEFALLQLNPTTPALGAALASKVLSALATPFALSEREVNISGSIGIAVFPDDAATPDGILKCADLALYEAKAQGRDCYHYFTSALDVAAHRRNLDQTELKRLDREQGFSLVYQPIIDARSGRTVVMEALLRFPGTVLSGSSVDYVVELAKEIGMIPQIGNWVFAEACSQLKEWRAAGIALTRIAVNTCAQELLDPTYVAKLVEVLDEFGLAAGSVDIELTERDAIELEKSGAPIAQRLRDMGFGLILDDFGTGYSALSYLRKLPVTGLKLDKSFLTEVPDDPDANAIAASVISLASQLRLTVTAEGVEHAGQVNFLREAGCNAFQGYLFAPPMSAEEAGDWLRADNAIMPSPLN